MFILATAANPTAVAALVLVFRPVASGLFDHKSSHIESLTFSTSAKALVRPA
jgi:ABC-type cobalt transport system substrate-binding protein